MASYLKQDNSGSFDPNESGGAPASSGIGFDTARLREIAHHHESVGSTEKGHFSSTQLLQAHHNVGRMVGDVNAFTGAALKGQSTMTVGPPVGMRSPTNSGRSVAYTNLPKQLYQNQVL